MKRFIRFLKFAAYPAFYLLCIGLFFYLTFPWDRLKDRLIAELSAQPKGFLAGKRIEIDELDSYWLTGVEAKGVRLFFPPFEDTTTSGGPFGQTAEKDKPAPKESVVEVDAVEARLQILPLIIGRVRIKFYAAAYNGTIRGTVPVGGSSGPVELDLEEIDLSKASIIKDFIGVPINGIAKGNLTLAAEGGKFSKSNGALDLAVANVSVGDGKSKIKGQIALPEAKLGDLTITAEAKDGVLKVTKLEANGSDLELSGDGKINVKENIGSSVADLYIRFKFTDTYRTKSDLTKSLLGAPGSSAPSLFELADPRIKKSKRADGFYGWHLHGTLGRPKYDPSATDGPATGRGRGKGDSPFVSKKAATPTAPKDDEAATEKPAAPIKEAAPPSEPPRAPALAPEKPEKDAKEAAPAEEAPAPQPQNRPVPDSQ